jgi:hypothetical protein
MGRLRTRDLLGRKLCRALAGLARHRDQGQSAALGRTPCRPATAHEFAAVKSHPILKEISESRTANGTSISVLSAMNIHPTPFLMNQIIRWRLIFQLWKLRSAVRFNRKPGCFANDFVLKSFWLPTPSMRRPVRVKDVLFFVIRVLGCEPSRL